MPRVAQHVRSRVGIVDPSCRARNPCSPRPLPFSSDNASLEGNKIHGRQEKGLRE